MKKVLPILLALLFCIPLSAQERPTVAVVLSGGGAKGVAHIGALRVIEEAGIPIDIICGTSMGALVGGLYSMGYSTDFLDSLVRAQDWTALLSDRTDPNTRRTEHICVNTQPFGASDRTRRIDTRSQCGRPAQQPHR